MGLVVKCGCCTSFYIIYTEAKRYSTYYYWPVKFFVVLPSLNIFSHIYNRWQEKEAPFGYFMHTLDFWALLGLSACQTPMPLTIEKACQYTFEMQNRPWQGCLYMKLRIIIVFKCISLVFFPSIENMMCFVYCSAVEDVCAESEKWSWKQLLNSFQASLCTKAIRESGVDKSYHCMKHNNS